MSKAYETIRNILVTEKSAVLKEANQYAFKVAPKADETFRQISHSGQTP